MARGHHFRRDKNSGSAELIVLGLLGALIVVLALPLISAIGDPKSGVANASTMSAPRR